jgi:hypothetical protein
VFNCLGESFNSLLFFFAFFLEFSLAAAAPASFEVKSLLLLATLTLLNFTPHELQKFAFAAFNSPQLSHSI